MRIIKILKKKIEGLLKEKPEVKQKKIIFDEIESYVSSKENEIHSILSESVDTIRRDIDSFISETNQKLDVLREVNLDKTKEDDRIKHLVLLNKNIYIKELEKLLQELNHLKHSDFNQYIKDINLRFFDFKKRSDDKYKKTTFLIGKEIAAVYECIAKFMKSYSRIVIDNEKHVAHSKTINVIKEKLKRIEANKNEIAAIEENIHKINSEIKILNQKINEMTLHIASIKNSKEHLENLENIEKQKNLILEINKELSNLKLMIDFKSLEGIFHASEKYRPIVKKFRENFNDHFKEDNGASLLNLLDEAKLKSKAIIEKIEDINFKSNELLRIKSMVLHDKVQSTSYELKKLESELNVLAEHKEKESRRIQRINSEIDIVKSSMKDEFLKVDVILEENKRKKSIQK